MQTDLFGNPIAESKSLTFEEEYAVYIKSPAWRAKRKAKLTACDRCESCGISRFSVKLEVHHKHYRSFKHERPEDLQVFCPECHKKADARREKEVAREQEENLYDARLEGWAGKKYGEDWNIEHDSDSVSEEFQQWLEDQPEDENYF